MWTKWSVPVTALPKFGIKASTPSHSPRLAEVWNGKKRSSPAGLLLRQRISATPERHPFSELNADFPEFQHERRKSKSLFLGLMPKMRNRFEHKNSVLRTPNWKNSKNDQLTTRIVDYSSKPSYKVQVPKGASSFLTSHLPQKKECSKSKGQHCRAERQGQALAFTKIFNKNFRLRDVNFELCKQLESKFLSCFP